MSVQYAFLSRHVFFSCTKSLRLNNYTIIMDSIAPIYPSLPVQEMMTEKQEPSTTVAPQPIASPGAPEVAPALLPQPSSTAGAPSTADPEHHSPQLYSPTKLEIDAHLIRQRLSYVRDDITTALSCAPSNSAAPEATRRQEPDAAPAQPVTTGAMADKGIKEGDEGKPMLISRSRICPSAAPHVCDRVLCFYQHRRIEARQSASGWAQQHA